MSFYNLIVNEKYIFKNKVSFLIKLYIFYKDIKFGSDFIIYYIIY